nr:cation diffusion facilitator family transporter [Deinobacterium chartae]
MLSLCVGALVLALKFGAYRLTGSVALYSDALESIINVAAAAAALIALAVARRPADANHPYGHSKAEYFSAVLEGVLIVLASLSILREAVSAFREPRALEDLGLGLGLSVVASVINGLLAAYLARLGRSMRSPALQADAKHIWSDVVTSLGVLVGVGLAGLTGWSLLDPLLAGLVALNILRVGWELVRESLGGLMDQSLSADILERVRDAVAVHGAGALEAHDLRTRSAGNAVFIEFHLVVPGEMTVAEAHHICDRLEEAIKAVVENSDVMIHVEPEYKAKHKGIVVI